MDAGALAFMVANSGPVGVAIRSRVRGERVAVPYLADIEVASALLGRRRGGKMTELAFERAWDAYGQLPLRRTEHVPVLARVRELFTNLSAYDATYVALAEGLAVPLVTSDARIARSGVARCKVEVFNERTH